MKTKEILDNIKDNGGFDNFRKWDKKEITEWVLANYDCSKLVAKKVAEDLYLDSKYQR